MDGAAMNGLITSPFVEGIVELMIGLVFVVLARLLNVPELQPIGVLVIGGGLMSLGLTKANNTASMKAKLRDEHERLVL